MLRSFRLLAVLLTVGFSLATANDPAVRETGIQPGFARDGDLQIRRPSGRLLLPGNPYAELTGENLHGDAYLLHMFLSLLCGNHYVLKREFIIFTFLREHWWCVSQYKPKAQHNR